MTRPSVRLVELEAEDLSRGGREAPKSLARAAETLHRGEVLTLRIHPTGATKAEAVRRAESALRALHSRLVDDWLLPEVELWAIFPTGRQASAKARTFAKFIERHLLTSASTGFDHKGTVAKVG